MDIVIGHLESLDVECETIRVVDHSVPRLHDPAERRHLLGRRCRTRPSLIEASGDEHPYTLKTAGWMAPQRRPHGAHPQGASDTPEGNTVPRAAMDEMSDMGAGQENRTAGAMMEDGRARSWWRRQ